MTTVTLIKKSFYSEILRTSVLNVPDPKITLQCTFTTPPFTLVKQPVSVFRQLLFGLGVLFRVSFVCNFYFLLVILLFMNLIYFYFYFLVFIGHGGIHY
jgi:hypothetical protein